MHFYDEAVESQSEMRRSEMGKLWGSVPDCASSGFSQLYFVHGGGFHWGVCLQMVCMEWERTERRVSE